MLKIGLTGGVGCGKSEVGKLFAAKGVPVFDADIVAREVVEPGRPAFDDIVKAFGQALVVDGVLDRKALREKVFADSAARRKLEAIVHPRVYQELSECAERASAPYCVFAIPLLIETGRQAFVDRMLVVDCAQEQQYARVRRRDGLDDTAIERVLQAQVSRERRLAEADDVIENSGSMEALAEQVERLHRAYLHLAGGHPAGSTQYC